MKFQPGQSGNILGRPKGSKNIMSQKVREDIISFLEGSFDKIKSDFDSLRPIQRVKYYIELLNFGIPKLSSTTVIEEFDKLTDEQLDEIIKRLKDETA